MDKTLLITDKMNGSNRRMEKRKTFSEEVNNPLPEEHLLEHAVGSGDSRETAGGQRVELKI